MVKFRFSRKKNKGVAAIEFAIGFIFFWYMIAAWVEMSFMSYVSSLGDLAISRAAQVAKKYENSDDGFLSKFNEVLSGQNSIWRYITKSNEFSYNITYLKTYDDLASYDGDCEEDEHGKTECAESYTDAAIAIYSITYNYKPIFNLFIDSKSLLSREMIVIQEYQRNEF